jgi:hypothetical protein
MGRVNAKNWTAADKVVKEQLKVTGQQMGVTNFMYKKVVSMYSAPKK